MNQFVRRPIRPDTLHVYPFSVPGSFLGVVRFSIIVICLLNLVSSLYAQDLSPRGIIVKELDLKMPINAMEMDKDGFLWAGTPNGLYRFDGFEFESIGNGTFDQPRINHTNITFLLEDQYGYLWISSDDGVYILTPDRSHSINLKDLIPGDFQLNTISSLKQLGDEIWLFNLSEQVTCIKPTGNKDKPFHFSRTIQVPKASIASAMQLDNGQYLIELTTRSHYYILSPEGKVIGHYASPTENTTFFRDTASRKVYALAPPELYVIDPYTAEEKLEASFLDIYLRPIPSWITASNRSPGSMWISGKLGQLLWYTPASGKYLDLTKLLSNRLYDGRFFTTNIGFEDKNGGFWLGTNQGVVYIRLPGIQYFSSLPLPQNLMSKQSFSTRGLLRAKDGSLFVSSYAGLYRYFRDGHIREYRIWNDVLNENVDPVVYDFLSDGNQIWMTSEGNGLLRYDFDTDSVYRTNPSSFYHQTQDLDTKALQWSFRIFSDHAGTKYLGYNAGMFVMDASGTLKRIHGLPGTGRDMGKVLDIIEDSSHTLWIAANSGLYSINENRDELKKHDLPSISGVGLQCLLAENNGLLWVGTRGKGILAYHPGNGTLTPYTSEHGLANDVVCEIQKADDGSIWISTNEGLARFDPQHKQFLNFYIEDGLPDNEFNHASSMKDEDGNLYFGGVSGVIHFHPQKNNFEQGQFRLRVSKIILHDGKNGATTEHLYNSFLHPEINLGYRDKYFIVYYAADNPTPYSRENFEYRLSGFHEDWQVNGTKNSIQFTGLQHGRYQLQIKSVNQQAQENILEIPVFIAQPFFKQWWAYVLYILTLGSIAFLILRQYFQRLHINRQLQLEIEHKARLQEINRSKSTFFTNITHEFKTPLTLIQGPAEEIARITKEPQVVKQAGLISKNAKAILALVNQLLELGKLEANLEAPQYHRLDIVQHVQQWLEKFTPLARQKEIRLGFETEQTAIYVDFDPVKMETVVNNLLSNAIKFTPEKGKVKCSISTKENAKEGKQVQIIVQDSGPGIAPDEQELIFDRFYQGKNSVLGGTGIGLAFVREMVRIHEGTVTLQSAPGEGATFIVSLPVFQTTGLTEKQFKHEKDAEDLMNVSPEILPEPLTKTNAEQPVVLIAEDHEDVAQLIRDVLDKDYQVFHVLNGRDAHHKALELIPDIIITDVMMPVMDGYSFTYLVKQELPTCHIPVIMLTAKDGEASRIEGRSHGADVYLQKPFSIQELQLTIRNLLHLKTRMAEKASKQLEANADEVEFSTATDKTFYQQFLYVLEDNLAESSLSVDDFTTKLGVSRTQLHRKLKAITGLSVNQIVRNVRLQKGLSMLKEGSKSISEIAYEVGFSNPSYFTERFKEYYGYPPSDVDKNPVPGPSSPT